jgi:hypothetical protein
MNLTPRSGLAAWVCQTPFVGADLTDALANLS